MVRTAISSVLRNRRSTARQLRFVGIAAVTALLATTSACSKSSTTSNSDAGGGIAKVAYTFSTVQGVPLDPIDNKAGGNHPYMQLMYDTMIHLTPQGLQPGLAVKWSFPDDRTIDLTLRQGVKFQDGTPFNAAAVKFSWDRFIAAQGIVKDTGLKALTSVDAPSEYSVVAHLSGPYASLWPFYLENATYLAVVSPMAVQKAGANFGSDPVDAGAGPYAFSSYTPNEQVTLTASKDYWNPSAVTLAGVQYINTAEGVPTIAALRSGVANIAFTSGGADINAAKSQGLDVSGVVRPDFEYGGYFCTNKAPFNSLDARKAVLYALDRSAFVAGPYGGFATENPAVVPTASSDWPGKTVTNPYDYSVSEAKSALAAAGVAPGTTITALANPTALNNATLQVIQAQLKAVGLNLDILPTASATADLKTKKPDIFFQGTGFQYASSQGLFVSPTGLLNYCKFNDPDLTSALTAATDPTLSPDASRQAWAAYQKIYYDVLPGFNIADIQVATVSTLAVSGISTTLDASNGEPAAWAGIKIKS